jgi:LPXTG-motif cell wall-anchored protein
LLQNHYPNWVARVNGQKTQIIPTNPAFMGVVVPAGDQVVEFRYEASGILYMAIGSLLFTLAGLVYFSRKKKKPSEQKVD